MKNFKYYLLTLVFILGFTIKAQESGKNNPVPTKVVEAVKNSKASEILPFINEKIELVLPNKSGVFSKEQAHFILKKFFEDHRVTSFNIIHHGTRQNATFAIGQYSCAEDNYRMYFLVKNKGEKALIHQIRIEKQE